MTVTFQKTNHFLDKQKQLHIGDEVFALKAYIMRPFPYAQLKYDLRKDKYNTHLCRAQRTVENAFRIFTMKWRIFLRPTDMTEENIK